MAPKSSASVRICDGLPPVAGTEPHGLVVGVTGSTATDVVVGPEEVVAPNEVVVASTGVVVVDDDVVDDDVVVTSVVVVSIGKVVDVVEVDVDVVDVEVDVDEEVDVDVVVGFGSPRSSTPSVAPTNERCSDPPPHWELATCAQESSSPTVSNIAETCSPFGETKPTHRVPWLPHANASTSADPPHSASVAASPPTGPSHTTSPAGSNSFSHAGVPARDSTSPNHAPNARTGELNWNRTPLRVVPSPAVSDHAGV